MKRSGVQTAAAVAVALGFSVWVAAGAWAQGFNLNGGNRSGQNNNQSGKNQGFQLQRPGGQNFNQQRPGQSGGASLGQFQPSSRDQQRQQNAQMLGQAIGQLLNSAAQQSQQRQQQQTGRQNQGGRVDRAPYDTRPGQNFNNQNFNNQNFNNQRFNNQGFNNQNFNSQNFNNQGLSRSGSSQNNFNSTNTTRTTSSSQSGYVEGRTYTTPNGTFRYQGGRLVPLADEETPPIPGMTSGAEPRVAASRKLPANDFALKARVITPAEMLAGKQAVIRHQKETLDALLAELEDQMIDDAMLIAEMGKLGMDAGTQKQILAAVQQHDPGQAQILWTTATQDAERALALNRQLSVSEALQELSETVSVGELTARDVAKARKAINRFELPARDKQAVMGLMDDLDSLANVYKAIASAAPASAGATVAISPGITEVIRHPDLKIGEAVSLGNGVFLIGTGGLGEMEMATEDLSAMIGLQRGAVEDIPEWVTTPTEGLILRNPARTKTPLSFTHDGKQQKLEAGQLAFVDATGPVTIRYNRGGSYGQASKSLTPGTYEFFGGQQGWELRPYKYRFTIDNSHGSNPFHCSLGGKAVTIAAGETYSLESDFPVEGWYDRGNGGDSRRVLLTAGVYNVGISTADNQLDLFASADHLAPAVTGPAVLPK